MRERDLLRERAKSSAVAYLGAGTMVRRHCNGVFPMSAGDGGYSPLARSVLIDTDSCRASIPAEMCRSVLSSVALLHSTPLGSASPNDVPAMATTGREPLLQASIKRFAVSCELFESGVWVTAHLHAHLCISRTVILGCAHVMNIRQAKKRDDDTRSKTGCKADSLFPQKV